ncbi:hypothetical protein CYJ36_07365 [Bacillus sp. UMB0893]|nr:hypothetical protein CYJ36_07365 [Bacillus sp. UMB0893]
MHKKEETLKASSFFLMAVFALIVVFDFTRGFPLRALAFCGEGWEPPRLCLWGLPFPIFPAGVKCLPLQSTKDFNHFSKSNKLFEKSLSKFIQ